MTIFGQCINVLNYKAECPYYGGEFVWILASPKTREEYTIKEY